MSTAVARVAAQPAAIHPIESLVEQHRPMLTALLPTGIDLHQAMGQLLLLTREQPKLLDVARKNPETLVNAFGRAVSLGGIVGRDVYLVPFWNTKQDRYEVSVITDYKFSIALVVAAGGARSVQARAVYANEPFKIAYGTNPSIEHEPLHPDERGDLIGAYAIARMSAYVTQFEYMPLAEIEGIRANSREWGPKKITRCPAWYAKKTVLNQLTKVLPKNAKLGRSLDLIAEQERLEFGEMQLVKPGAPVAAIGAGASDDDDEPMFTQAPAWPAITTEAARAYLLPGGPQHFKGYGGQPLGQVPRAVLESVVTWSQDTTYEHAAELRAHVLAVLEIDDESEQPSEAKDAEPASRGRSDDTEQVHVADATTGATRPGEATAQPALALGDAPRKPRTRMEDV
jgi:phage RecT family recombinase